MNVGRVMVRKRKVGIINAFNSSPSCQAMARPERREELREYVSASHHFSCSIGLPALRSWKEAREDVNLTSSDLHADALTSGLVVVAASGT
jgi:hypothetical protein